MSVTVLLLVIAGIAALGLRAGVTTMNQRIRAHGLALIIVRYLLGQPHHGQPITDATWSSRATRALTPTGHARDFWWLPQRARARRRCTRVTLMLLYGWGLIFHRERTLVSLACLTLLGAVLGAWQVRVWWRGLRHHRTWEYPAHITAAPLAGWSLMVAPKDWLMIEPDRSYVRAELPQEFNADAKGRDRLAGTLAVKLGIESPDVRYELAGPRPFLELTQAQPPPEKVPLADITGAIEAARADDLVWGIGKRGGVVKTSLSGDSPHVGLSMGSGAGKSVTARSLLAQQLHKGAIGLILDYKMISHQWAAGLPNVVIARRPSEIHAALCWLGGDPTRDMQGEVERRNEVALAGADADGNVHAVVGRRLIVVCEELNATVARLRAYWRQERGRDDPIRSPALEALDNVSFMGRQVLVNVIYIGQRLSVRASGGDGDARENIGVIAFGRYSASNWKMLAPDFAMPPKSLAPGRIQVVSDQVRETQGIYMTALEAREYALSGVVSPLPAGMPGAPAAVESVSPAGELDPGPDLRLPQFQPGISPSPVSGPVTLSEAVAEGWTGGLTLAGVRTARHRDPAFPAHVGRRGLALEYDPAALAVWAAARKE